MSGFNGFLHNVIMLVGRSHFLYSLMTCLAISCARHSWQLEWLARPCELRHTRGGETLLQRLNHSVTVIILPISSITQFPVHVSCSSIYILIRFWGVMASFGVAWSKRFFLVCCWISIYAPCELARPFQTSFCCVVWQCLPIFWLMAGYKRFIIPHKDPGWCSDASQCEQPPSCNYSIGISNRHYFQTTLFHHHAEVGLS